MSAGQRIATHNTLLDEERTGWENLTHALSVAQDTTKEADGTPYEYPTESIEYILNLIATAMGIAP